MGDLTFVCVLILFLYAVGSFPTWAHIFLVITLFLAFVASAFMVCTFSPTLSCFTDQHFQLKVGREGAPES